MILMKDDDRDLAKKTLLRQKHIDCIYIIKDQEAQNPEEF